MDGVPTIEVRMVGREGMLGAQLVVGVKREALYAVVQSRCLAWRVDSRRLEQELTTNSELRIAVGRYFNLTFEQLALSAACMRFHNMAPRLARWMLVTQDRVRADRFQITHKSLSLLLGVRRVSVTVAATALQRQGLVTYHRGQVTIVDRQALTRLACSCYAADRKSYSAYLREVR